MLDEATLAYGGLDGIAVTAGIFVPPDPQGHIPDDQWALTFAINVTGTYLVADEAGETLEGAGPARQSGADHQRQRGGREERQPGLRHQQGRRQPSRARTGDRAGAAGARQRRGAGDGGARQRHVPARSRDRLAREVQHRLTPKQESDDALREKLAQFYAERTLTKSPITPADQAEAFFLLLQPAGCQQDHRPGHHRGRRVARSVLAMICCEPILAASLATREGSRRKRRG